MRKFKFSKTDISFPNMEMYCEEIARIIREHHSWGMSIEYSHNIIYPLWHYLFTGRASAEFCHRLLQAKPFMIARKIEKGGSHDEIVSRIKAYLNYQSTF